MSLKSINKKLEELFNYILENYTQKDKSFPLTKWAQHISSIKWTTFLFFSQLTITYNINNNNNNNFILLIRWTTNFCKSFHSCFYFAFPNKFRLINWLNNYLKEVQIETYIKLRTTKKKN
jgi:hypothetical protein